MPSSTYLGFSGLNPTSNHTAAAALTAHPSIASHNPSVSKTSPNHLLSAQFCAIRASLRGDPCRYTDAIKLQVGGAPTSASLVMLPEVVRPETAVKDSRPNRRAVNC
jgi:phage tail sheath gpL-like